MTRHGKNKPGTVMVYEGDIMHTVLKFGLGTAAVSEHRMHRLFSYTYLTSHVLSVQSTSRVCWLTVTVTMAYRMTCL